jgi:D-arabinose 1-dehydrogenase-like Zn-dependent alcohol dehydrogenase
LLEPGKIPLTLGHEVAGEVAEVGGEVKEFQKGDRVVIRFYFNCGSCCYCQSGSESLCTQLIGHMGFTVDSGYAEYVKAPARSLSRLPKDISFDEGGILADAVSSTFHAVRSVAQVRAGESVVVYGLGGLGLHAVQIARLCGARVIGVDIIGEKLAMARELGADDTINPNRQEVVTEVKRITGEGADVVLEFVGLCQPRRLSVSQFRLC